MTSMRQTRRALLAALLPLVEQGYDLIAPIPSCVLMFKQELPLMFPDDPAVQRIRKAFFDPFEYLMLRHKAGKLRTDFAATLGAIAHYDFGLAGAYGYEQAVLVIRRLGLGVEAVEQQFRRMVFNVMARNQDDHAKNIAFLMDKSGRWSLAPAYDVIHSYNPAGEWTSQHQMTVNGKRDGFTGDDLRAVAATARISRARGLAIVEEVRAAVTRWEEFAEHAKVRAEQITAIAADRRLSLR